MPKNQFRFFPWAKTGETAPQHTDDGISAWTAGQRLGVEELLDDWIYREALEAQLLSSSLTNSNNLFPPI